MPRMYYFSGLSSSRQYSRSGLSSWVLEETKWLPRISWPARLFFIVRFVYTSIWDTKRVEEPSRFSPGWRTRNLQQDENQKVIGQLDYWPGRSRWWRNVGREFFQIPLDCLKNHDTRAPVADEWWYFVALYFASKVYSKKEIVPIFFGFSNNATWSCTED